MNIIDFQAVIAYYKKNRIIVNRFAKITQQNCEKYVFYKEELRNPCQGILLNIMCLAALLPCDHC